MAVETVGWMCLKSSHIWAFIGLLLRPGRPRACVGATPPCAVGSGPVRGRNGDLSMRIIGASALFMLSVGLAGCGPEGPSKADTGMVVGAVAGGILGNQVGKGSGNIAATALGAVVGGIVGSEIGRSLDEQDRRLAQEAEFYALERGQSGVSRQWRNPNNGRYGEVVPSRPYKRGNVDCRDYTHKIFVDGRPQSMRGTACRNPDGTWSNVG